MHAYAQVYRTKERATDATGYEVTLWDDDGKIVEEYCAGANTMDSGWPGVNETSTVKKWARKTAKEMFKHRFGRWPKRGEVVVVVKFLDC